MATLEPPRLRGFAAAWEAAIDSAARRDDAATFAGIVGDLAHRREGGYHISREDQPDPNNYSVADCPEDREGRSDLASAVDITMDPGDMTLVTGRLYRSWRDAYDPRLNVCRGINGTLDGQNAIRFDCQFATLESATDDHLWHVHMEFLRKYADDSTAHGGVLSVIVGESVAEWRNRGVVGAPGWRDPGEDDMPQLLKDGFGIDETGARIPGSPFTPIAHDCIGGGLARNGPAWLVMVTDPWGQDDVARVRVCTGDGQTWGKIQSIAFGVRGGWVHSIPLPTGSFVTSAARCKQRADDKADSYEISYTVRYGPSS